MTVHKWTKQAEKRLKEEWGKWEGSGLSFDHAMAALFNVSFGSINAKRIKLGLVGRADSVTPSKRKQKTNKDIIQTHLKTNSASVGDLSRLIDRSKETIIKILDELRVEGYDINLDTSSKQVILERERKSFAPLSLKEQKNLYHKNLKIGVVSDTHIGSKYQQMTALHTAYNQMEKEGVDFVLHVGDLTDGINMYRGQETESFLHGFDEQAEYTIKNYPKSNKFKTYIIGGNHDHSFKKTAGANVVRYVCSKRSDLVYRGAPQATFKIKNCNIFMLHPSGGVSYARSYKLQKIIEAATGAMLTALRTLKEANQELPHILLLGHFHIGSYLPQYMGVEGMMSYCFQAQTPYLKEKGLAPEVGYTILNISFTKNNKVSKVLPDFRYLPVLENDY